MRSATSEKLIADTTSSTPPIVEDDAVVLALELTVGDDVDGRDDVVENNRHIGLAVRSIKRTRAFDFCCSEQYTYD